MLKVGGDDRTCAGSIAAEILGTAEGGHKSFVLDTAHNVDGDWNNLL